MKKRPKKLETAPDVEVYRGDYSERQFWGKVSALPREAAGTLLEKVLTLYVLLCDRNTPAWARLLITGVLGYFICPLDLVPDVAPILGYVDDAALAALMIVELDQFLTPAHRGRVRSLMPESLRKP